jgi:dTDP-4-amino-4,6-dideoxygalactose transaminase
LKYLPAWTAKRRSIAAHYRSTLEGARVVTPREFDNGHVYHLFPVLTDTRDRFQAHMKDHGIETLIHYPIPIPRQPALQSTTPSVCADADRVCSQLVSLPMYPGLSASAVNAVAEAVATFGR